MTFLLQANPLDRIRACINLSFCIHVILLFTALLPLVVELHLPKWRMLLESRVKGRAAFETRRLNHGRAAVAGPVVPPRPSPLGGPSTVASEETYLLSRSKSLRRDKPGWPLRGAHPCRPL